MSVNEIRQKEFTGASVFMPIIDEFDSVLETVRIILDTCDRKDITEFILIVAQRGGEERVNRLNILKEKYPDVKFKIFVQSQNGVGGASREAIAVAEGSHIVSIASDLQFDPVCVSQMIERGRVHPDMVFSTSRWLLKHNFDGYSKSKKVLNYLGQRFICRLYGVHLTDVTTPVQICPTEYYRHLILTRDDFSFFIEVSLKLIRIGAEFEEIPVKFSPRTEGRSHNSFIETAKFLPVTVNTRFLKTDKVWK